MLREERRRREEWKRITVQSLDRSKDELHFNDNRDVRNTEREREEWKVMERENRRWRRRKRGKKRRKNRSRI